MQSNDILSARLVAGRDWHFFECEDFHERVILEHI
jgi:hypothetical protein